jgi:hypothetical protein
MLLYHFAYLQAELYVFNQHVLSIVSYKCFQANCYYTNIMYYELCICT